MTFMLSLKMLRLHCEVVVGAIKVMDLLGSPPGGSNPADVPPVVIIIYLNHDVLEQSDSSASSFSP